MEDDTPKHLYMKTDSLNDSSEKYLHKQPDKQVYIKGFTLFLPAEVDIVHEQPITSLEGLNQYTVHPLKTSVCPAILQLGQTLLQQSKVHLQLGHV